MRGADDSGVYMGGIPVRGRAAECAAGREPADFSEWLPALREYEFAAGYCVEWYDDPAKYANGTQDENYICEIWIPVKKKSNS